jgi:Flp pilus assembly protein TadG
MNEYLRSMMMPKGTMPKVGGIKSIVGSLRRFGACHRGTSSVEFVLVLGPMMLFLFGIIGFGLITYAHTNMVNAAREATRRMSVAEDVVIGNGSTVTCSPAALATLATDVAPKTAVQQIACDYLTDWAIQFNVSAGFKDPGGPGVVPECDPAVLAVEPNYREVTVLITALASDAFMVDIWDLFTGTLEAEVTMRREAAC